MTDFFINPQILENGETLIQMKDAHLHFPMPTSPSRVQHWIRTGTGGVCLGTVTVGRQRFTSEQEIRRFLLAQQNPSVPAQTIIPASSRRTSPATMASEDIDSELRRFGFNDLS
jgi:hypothetical protein